MQQSAFWRSWKVVHVTFQIMSEKDRVSPFIPVDQNINLCKQYASHPNLHCYPFYFGFKFYTIVFRYFISCYQLQYACGMSKLCHSWLKHQKMGKSVSERKCLYVHIFFFIVESITKMFQTGNQSTGYILFSNGSVQFQQWESSLQKNGLD